MIVRIDPQAGSMNRDELKKMTDQVVRIRPEARRFDWNGDDLGPVDYHWRIAATGSDSLELEYLKRSLALPEPELGRYPRFLVQ